MTVAHRPLILASSSRYRKELLERLRLSFLTISPDIDESPLSGEPPRDMALRLSLAKARAVIAQNPGSIVIGSDQAASLHGRPVGKPGCVQAARDQLQARSGQTVVVHTALTVISPDSVQTAEVPTSCEFRTLSAAAIERYIAIDNPLDTAGSAKAESLGIALMRSMQSDDPTAIIGLPLITLTRMLAGIGLDPLDAARLSS